MEHSISIDDSPECYTKETTKRKSKKNRCKITPWDVFEDFTSNTSLHGLKYVTEKTSLFERMFWTITFIISIVLCSVLIYNVWYKWRYSPVIVTFSEQSVPVWKVPFPSVTICPQIKCKQTVFNYSMYFEEYLNNPMNISESRYLMFDQVSTVCDPASFIDFPSFNDVTNATLIENIIKVAPNISDVLKVCKWRGNEVECSELFHEVLTNEGLCFTFNTLSKEDMFNEESIQNEYKYLYTSTPIEGWTTSKGYVADKIKDAYPKIGRENSAKPDLKIVLQENSTENDKMCNSLNRGYKVYVHHPADMPQSSLYYYAIIRNQVTALAVKFNMVSTSSNLINYSPEVRQCYFPSDRNLRYFQEYTQHNCELECRANRTFEKCGCVWFDMPHNDSTQICSVSRRECTQQAKEEVADSEILAAIEAEMGNYSRPACRCLPACNTVSYDAEVLKTEFNLQQFFKTLSKMFFEPDLDQDSSRVSYSSLTVYFKEPRFVSMRRSELFGVTDFLANCGGLLGLFLGFSFLSLIEIMYFPTLRVCFSLLRDKVAPKENLLFKKE